MLNSDVLRSVRYILNLRDAAVLDIIALGGLEVPPENLRAFLLKEEEEGFEDCPGFVLAYFLEGLIFHKRGKDESRPALPVEKDVTNNLILKKLRVAFTLKESDVVELIRAGGIQAGAHEVNAFFRRPEHPNYRECGDQYLRNFLRGLTLRVRGPKASK